MNSTTVFPETALLTLNPGKLKVKSNVGLITKRTISPLLTEMVAGSNNHLFAPRLNSLVSEAATGSDSILVST